MNGTNDFSFPFPPYDIQNQFMAALTDTLEQKKLGIFESPTGTVSTYFSDNYGIDMFF